jgi:hypothetical protein
MRNTQAIEPGRRAASASTGGGPIVTPPPSAFHPSGADEPSSVMVAPGAGRARELQRLPRPLEREREDDLPVLGAGEADVVAGPSPCPWRRPARLTGSCNGQ